MDKDRASLRTEGDTYRLRASALDRCPQRLWREHRYGPEPVPPQVAAAAEIGRQLEGELIRRAQDHFRLPVPVQQCPGEVEVDNRLIIDGTCDALADDTLIEAKTVGRAEQLRPDLWHRWVGQLSAYVAMWEPQRVALSVASRETFSWQIYGLSSDELWGRGELRDRTLRLLDQILADSKPQCICGYCSDAPLVDLPDVAVAAIELVEWKRLRRVVDEAIEQATRRLQEAYDWDNQPARALDVPGFGRVRWVPPTLRSSFDAKRHADESPECHARYVRDTESGGYFRVTISDD